MYNNLNLIPPQSRGEERKDYTLKLAKNGNLVLPAMLLNSWSKKMIVDFIDYAEDNGEIDLALKLFRMSVDPNSWS